ncbi:MAG: hypothetical protein Tsb009_22600 [Planctomycetaceae bacterium]
MSRVILRTTIIAAVLIVGAAATAKAQVRWAGGQVVQPGRFPGAGYQIQPMPRQVYRPARPVYYAAPQARVIQGRQPAQAVRTPQGYPYLNAPLYSSPVQNVPYQMGGTMITNQAFAPHEMLHPHTYRALYPPFYYKVRGSWFVWPWGVESYDRWELQGTEVKIEYRSQIPLLSRFTRPWFR